jgi:phospholipid transport system transporter-binding protein
MSTKIIKQESGHLAIDGELNMQTVPAIATQLLELINHIDSKNMTIDLASVSRSDSAGVALLVEAMQLAKEANLSLSFSHLPQQMRDIASVSGLLDILPVSKL